MEASAHAIFKRNYQLHLQHLKLKGLQPKTIEAIAHKMIRLIYVLLTRKEAYHDPQIEYAAMSAKKNAPRWIKQLKLIGKWPRKTSATASNTVCS